jgi:hypothetical protein
VEVGYWWFGGEVLMTGISLVFLVLLLVVK